MPDAFPLPASVAVARLTTDKLSVGRISDVLTESFDPDVVAIAAHEEANGRWPITLYFREPPDEAAVRALVVTRRRRRHRSERADVRARSRRPGLGAKAASMVSRRSRPAGSSCMAHDRARAGSNRIGIEIEAASRLRHRASRHHARLPAGARPPAQGTHRRRACSTSAPAPACWPSPPRGRCTGRCWRAISTRAPCRTARENARHQPRRIADRGVAGRRSRRPPIPRRVRHLRSVLANILLRPLKRTRRPMARLVAPGGIVVLSGLLRAHATSVARRFAAHGFALKRRIPLEGWVTLVLERAAPTASPRTGLIRVCLLRHCRCAAQSIDWPHVRGPFPDVRRRRRSRRRARRVLRPCAPNWHGAASPASSSRAPTGIRTNMCPPARSGWPG